MRVLRRLAPCKGRIEFTCVWDRSFASGYSPPRTEAFLGTAQFPLATRLSHVTGGLRLALVGFMVSSAYVGGGFNPRISTHAGSRRGVTFAGEGRLPQWCGFAQEQR